MINIIRAFFFINIKLDLNSKSNESCNPTEPFDKNVLYANTHKRVSNSHKSHKTVSQRSFNKQKKLGTSSLRIYCCYFTETSGNKGYTIHCKLANVVAKGSKISKTIYTNENVNFCLVKKKKGQGENQSKSRYR